MTATVLDDEAFLDDLLIRLRTRGAPKLQAFDKSGNKINFAVFHDDRVEVVPADRDCAEAAVVIEALLEQRKSDGKT